MQFDYSRGARPCDEIHLLNHNHKAWNCVQIVKKYKHHGTVLDAKRLIVNLVVKRVIFASVWCVIHVVVSVTGMKI